MDERKQTGRTAAVGCVAASAALWGSLGVFFISCRLTGLRAAISSC
jgi:hypothetical protein